MKEIELIDIFCSYLESKKIEYKRELRKGGWHNEGYFDIVVKIGNKYHAIEAKINNFSAVFHQSVGNRVLIPYSWILYNKQPTVKSIRKCKRFGIGLVIFKNEKFKFIYHPSPKAYDFMLKHQFEKVKQNWRENRCGRVIHKKELPENYDRKKVDDLLPIYEWTKIKNVDNKSNN